MGKRPQPVNRESVFAPEEIFFSTTDLKGIILSGNDVFVRISKYSKDELTGSPHNIIRHPDMPKIVFKLLWDYIQSGKTIVAYVKNMAKDGSFYWVLATVMPVVDESGKITEYMSIRIKPTSKYFSLIPELYAQMLEAEKEGGMEASYTVLMEALKSLGYRNYEDFMKDVLVEELKDKKTIFNRVISSLESSESCILQSEIIMKKAKHLYSSIEGLFGKLSRFENLKNLFSQKAESVYKIADDIRLTALNSSVESLRLGSNGAVFSVISAEMRKNSEEESKIIKQMKVLIDRNTQEIKDVMYTLSLLKLEIFMFINFLNTIDKLEEGEKKADLKNFFLLLNSSEMFFRQLSSLISGSIESLKELDRKIKRLKLLIEELEAMYFRGLIEAGHMSGTNFAIIFTYVRELVTETKGSILTLEEPLGHILEDESILHSRVEVILRELIDLKKTVGKKVSQL
ncbi:methyl-accepting chemotaxis protein [Persephonella sp.]